MTATLDARVLDKAWDDLDNESKTFGRRHARKLATSLGQGSLFELDTLREAFLRREAEAHPGKLVVKNEDFEEFRFMAGIAASLIDEAEVRRTNWPYMWGRILESTLGSRHYDLATQSYTLSEEQAAAIFAADYEWTAAQRLMGGKLIENYERGVA